MGKASASYIDYLTGKIYKLIPLREGADRGEDVHLKQYFDSLLMELEGAMLSCPELGAEPYFVSVFSTASYMREHPVDIAVWRRESFKMLNSLNRLREKLGGEANA